jgi:hypothetical protein
MNNTTIILGTVLVVMIVYMLFRSYFNGEQKLLSKTLLKNAVVPSVISNPNASNFSYGIWIYVNKWIAPGTAEEQTRIFTRKDEVGLYLENDASLKIRFADLAGRDVKAINKPNNYTSITLTNNFPIQKWVHVGLVVEGNKFDGYIDGKMVKSIELNGMGIIPSLVDGKAKNQLEFGTTNAMANTLMVAEHKRRIYAMDPKGMWDLYMEGNGSNGLTNAASNVNVNLSILKDGVESSKFSLW